MGIFDKPRRYMDNGVVKLIKNALLSLSLVHANNRLALGVRCAPLYLPANFLACLIDEWPLFFALYVD